MAPAGDATIRRRGRDAGLLGRARSQLKQTVREVLSHSRQALVERISSGLATTLGLPEKGGTGDRLRDVVHGDRALHATQSHAAPTSRGAQLTSPNNLTLDIDSVPTIELAPADAAAPSAHAAPDTSSEARSGEPGGGAPSDGAAATAMGPEAPAPAEVPARPPEPDEPIKTRSMARLLAAQGHPARALAILDWLASAPSADPGLRVEADELRARIQADATPEPPPESA